MRAFTPQKHIAATLAAAAFVGAGVFLVIQILLEPGSSTVRTQLPTLGPVLALLAAFALLLRLSLRSAQNEFRARFAGERLRNRRRRLMEHTLHAKTALFEAQTNASPDGILIVDQNHHKILYNQRLIELFNVPRHIQDDPDDAALLNHVVSLTKFPEKFLEKVRYLYAHPADKSTDEIEFVSGMVLDRYSAPVTGTNGENYGRIWTFRDITARKNALEGLRKLSRVVEQTPTAVVIAGLSGNMEYVNPAFTETYGYTAQEALGQNPRMLQSGLTPARTYTEMWTALKAGREWRGELQNRHKNGKLIWELATISPLRNADGKTTHYVAVKENITALKTMEDELRYAALTDELTGLPNRAVICDHLQQLVLRANRGDFHFATLFLDLDSFKTVNDSLGHEAGDMLLKEVAQRLRATMRSSDSLSRYSGDDIAARLGGDEFVILLDGIAGPSDAAAVADRLIEVIARPYRLGDHEICLTVSIGVVARDKPDDSAEEILRDADTAMYEAKVAGKNRHMTFDASMHQRVQRRLDLETDLRTAIPAGQMFLIYQPIVSLNTPCVVGFEALLRWNHPKHGILSPAEFLPIAEETGLILPLGEWVLRQACAQFAEWRDTLGDRAPRQISVNLSRRQLVLADLPETIQRILAEHKMSPDSLHLEITESAMMLNIAASVRLLRAIRDIGVKLEIDDFGTGYSSLSSLREFPIDVLKIDRSFVDNMDRGPDFLALIQAVTQLARKLNIRVLAEGIETTEQVARLRALDCDLGQGYLFSKPLTPEEAANFRIDSRLIPTAAAA